MTTLADIPLPAAIRSRYVEGINGLRMHVLEAGFETKGRPCLLLLHGFPELAFSWRKMPALAASGYHVIAPDQRGWPHHRMGCELRRRSRRVPAAQSGARVGAGVGVPLRTSRRRIDMIRPSVAACFGAARLFRSVALMSAVCERTVTALQHRGWAQNRRRRPRASRTGGTAASAKALPMVLLDARSECRHAPRATGQTRFPARLLSSQERGLKDNAPHPLNHGRRASWQTADLLCDGRRRIWPRPSPEEIPSTAEIAANQWLPDSELAFYAPNMAAPDGLQ